MEKKILSRSDYFYMGLAFAVLLSGRDEFRDGTWQLILAGLFFVLTGVRENCRMLLDFVRRFPLYAVFTVIWTGYFALIRRPDIDSYRYAVVLFAVIFGAYCVAQEGEDAITEAFRKMWMVLLTTLAVCDIHYMLEKLSLERMNLFFLNPNIEGYAIIAFLLLSLFLINHKILQTGGVILAAVSAVLTGSKACTIIAAIGLLYLFIVRLKHMAGSFRIRKIHAFFILPVVVLCALLAGSFLMKQESGAFARLLNRYLQAISDVKNIADGSQTVDYATSTNYRIYVIKTALEFFTRGAAVEVSIGRGLLQQYYHVLQPVISRIYSLTGTQAGPAENTFLSLMYDYGAASFVMLLGTFVSALIGVFRLKRHLVRSMAATLAGMMLLVATVDMEYYINIMFVICIFTGVYLGVMGADEKRRILIPSMVFCAFLIPVIYLIPAANSHIRTLIEGNALIQEASYFSLMWFSIAATVVSVVTVIIVLSMLICKFVYERHINRKLLIAGGVACVFLAAGMVTGNQLIRRVTLALDGRLQKEAGVIREIKEQADGKLYACTFPEAYERTFGGFSRSVFYGAELVCYDDVTIVTDIDAESNVYGSKGFLFMPLSDDTGVYTNDNGVIAYLLGKGRRLTGYNPYVHRIDVSETGDNKDVSLFMHAGLYTMTFDLSVNPGADIEGKVVGTVSILPETADGRGADREATPVVSETISGAMFDAQGKLSHQIKCNIPSTRRVHVLTEGGETFDLKLNEITYQRTPDYDVHVQVNQYGDRLLEKYYDLEGNPYQIPAGYYGVRKKYDAARQLVRQEYLDAEGSLMALAAGQAAVEFEYDEAGNRTVTRYYDASNEPVLYNGQYWLVQVTFNDKRQVVREAYLGTDGAPVALAAGQAAVEYEYDEAGNRTVTRYFDTLNEPVLYNGQYWYVDITYNDQKQNVLEMYYGTDGKPILLSDGAAGYRREYDEAGNIISCSYLGIDGNPALNTSGYATWRRTFNDKKLIVREEYYDPEDQPLALAAGHAAVEYEYDEAGNRTVSRYFDASNEPVLYNGQYWYVDITYNDQKQNVLERYYGTDGNPIPLSDGAAGYRREYDEEGNIISCSYLGIDGNPALNTSGYATWRRTFNDKKQIIRESYYDTEDAPVALAAGQAAVEYEYDDAGNTNVWRYFDTTNTPVMYNGQYWCRKVTYNEKKQNVLDLYFGTDEKPILLSDGAAGYRREYDENGNVNCLTYLDGDGNPTTNIYGYTTRHIIYNDKKQVVRETYFDTEDQPVALATGQAAVEYEYNEAGEVSGKTYYDIEGREVTVE